jgi:uncharacterized protein
VLSDDLFVQPTTCVSAAAAHGRSGRWRLQTLVSQCELPLQQTFTLSPDSGGVFDTLLSLARHGLGGRAGHGRQFMSWIHYQDFIAAVQWLIDRDDIEGAVNVASPNPLPNAEFMRVFREACGASFGLPTSRWMLEIGAVFMRTETELILKSRRVVPARLLEHGFEFRYPDWRNAAEDLFRQWKAARDKALVQEGLGRRRRVARP